MKLSANALQEVAENSGCIYKSFLRPHFLAVGARRSAINAKTSAIC